MPQIKDKVLIVDDNRTDRMILRAILEKLRFTDIQEAEDGSVAESKIVTALDVRQPFDIVFVDWNMPKKNGLRLLESIKANSRLKNTIVILMTATAEENIVENAIMSGVKDFLVKPFVPAIVEEKVKKIIK